MGGALFQLSGPEPPDVTASFAYSTQSPAPERGAGTAPGGQRPGGDREGSGEGSAVGVPSPQEGMRSPQEGMRSPPGSAQGLGGGFRAAPSGYRGGEGGLGVHRRGAAGGHPQGMRGVLGKGERGPAPWGAWRLGGVLERLGRGLCTPNFHAVPVVCPLAALQPPEVAEENPLGMGGYPPGEPGHSGLTSGKPRGDGEVLLGSLSPTLGHWDHQQWGTLRGQGLLLVSRSRGHAGRQTFTFIHSLPLHIC